MEFKIEDEKIWTRDVPIMKEMYALQNGDYVNFLTSFIIDWTLPYSVKPYVVAQLNFAAITPIIKYASDKIKEINNDMMDIERAIMTLIMSEGKVRLRPDSIIMMKYADRLRLCMPCVDNYANLIMLPSGRTTEEVRIDDFIILESIIKAKIKYLDESQKRMKRKG
jgi:hypothetical protein